MRLSCDELITFFQSGLMLDFGIDDNYVIQSLSITMQELQRMKLEIPTAPRSSDPVEKPTKPFGCFEPPSVEQLIASMQGEVVDGSEFLGRPSIPPDGGPAIVPDALLKRNASNWSFLGRENDEVSSSHASAVATDCPSSRTSLVSNLLDNIGSVSTTNEPGIVSFTTAECTVSSRTTLTGHSVEVDQISNSEYDNVPANTGNEFSSVYEQELEQTLESIEQEIHELLGMHAESEKCNETVYSTAMTQNDQLPLPSVITSPSVHTPQQNHISALPLSAPSVAESSAQLDSALVNISSTSHQRPPMAKHFSLTSPSPPAAGGIRSAPVIPSSTSNSSQLRQLDTDLVVIPIEHLPSSAPYRPPIKPKPTNIPLSPSSEQQSPTSVLTPIPVLHLRTVPISQFNSISSLSAAKRPVPTSSTNYVVH